MIRRAVAALAIGAVGTQPAIAQASGDFFTGQGGWRVMVRDGDCALSRDAAGTSPRITFFGTRNGYVWLTIDLPQSLDADVDAQTVSLRMGSTHERMGLSGERDRLELVGFPDNLIAAFRQSETIELLAGDQTIGAIPLAGSSAAWTQFARCMPSLPPSLSLPPPPRTLPRPVIPEPQLSVPLPANRPARPIMLQSWFSSDDYPSQELANSGTTAFVVDVGPDGHARSCEVTQSSGSALLDEATCRVVTDRARFDPATDGKGRPIAGRFASSVGWQRTG